MTDVRAEVHYVSDADHSFAVKGAKRSPYEIGASLAPRVVSFVAGDD